MDYSRTLEALGLSTGTRPDRTWVVTMSQAASSSEFDEIAASRRGRLRARMAAMGQRPHTAAEILAAPPAEDDDYPGDEEFDAYLSEIYAARDRDLAQ